MFICFCLFACPCLHGCIRKQCNFEFEIKCSRFVCFISLFVCLCVCWFVPRKIFIFIPELACSACVYMSKLDDNIVSCLSVCLSEIFKNVYSWTRMFCPCLHGCIRKLQYVTLNFNLKYLVFLFVCFLSLLDCLCLFAEIFIFIPELSGCLCLCSCGYVAHLYIAFI